VPNAEVACLIREKFSDKELKAMGLFSIETMHEPIEDSDGDSKLLGANRMDDGSGLSTDYDDHDHKWHRCRGFAFVVRQVSVS
jgi:hypothetical protein